MLKIRAGNIFGEWFYAVNMSVKLKRGVKKCKVYEHEPFRNDFHFQNLLKAYNFTYETMTPW